MDALTVVRLVVVAGVGLAAFGALAAMAVQRRLLSPFRAPARTVRRLTDPLLKPIERRILRSGGNPQSAPWWLMGVAIGAGILAITLAEWLLALLHVAGAAVAGGPRSTVALVVGLAFDVLMIALLVRVVGSWFGAGPYTKWMRPFHRATEWMLAPIRRALGTGGAIDFSPLVAWLILWLLRPAILGLL